jgi:hypothetical protein
MLLHVMWHSSPHLIHSIPLGGSCHKGLPAAQQYWSKVSGFTDLCTIWRVQTKNTHRKLDNHSVTQLLRRLACSISWKRSCLLSVNGIAVFSVSRAQSSSMCSTWSGRNSWKLQLHYCFQFPWCALTLTAVVSDCRFSFYDCKLT